MRSKPSINRYVVLVSNELKVDHMPRYSLVCPCSTISSLIKHSCPTNKIEKFKLISDISRNSVGNSAQTFNFRFVFAEFLSNLARFLANFERNSANNH